MRGTRQKNPGFTLIELILVMVIIAIAAGIVAPALATFTAGRAIDNCSRQILALAQYAHTQSISEARTYRLNFDESSRQYWLTADSGAGTFDSLKGDFSQRYTAPAAMQIKVDITPQPNTNLLLPPNIQQQQVPQSGTALNGQQAGAAGSIMQNLHSQGTYIEFQSTGRTDPATITLTDSSHHTKQVVCATPTEMFQVVEGAQR
ncbi:MAG TPA: prepilin-type N-terminal cleavage/methylation domain-containing protein [Tepidisphaeraceae bacterium]|jgi:prepilin-type N-terminal cleavage/methylation domain-containing protein